MKQKFVIDILLLVGLSFCLPTFAIAQSQGLSNVYRFADPYLKLAINENPVDFVSGANTKNKGEYIRLVVESTHPSTARQILSLGGKINTSINNFYTVQIEKDKVSLLADLQGLERLYLGEPLKLANDIAIKNVRADLVHQGIEPLPRGYTGKDVVVGIIDTGIDFKHTDFLNPNDPQKSRVAYLWDQKTEEGNGQSPENFFYGQEWTRQDIERELSNTPPQIISHLDTQRFSGGHGTHVTGTAAGNDGLAPDADIIVVASTQRTADIIDAANYIREKAEALGKPCVINMSFGGTFNPHDGTSVLSSALNQMLEGTKGFVICAAAGNEGNDASHWGDFELNEDEPTMLYGTGVTTLAVYFRIPKSEGKDISFAVALDSADFDASRNNLLVPYKTVGETEWISAKDLIGKSAKQVYLEYEHSNGELAGTILFSGQEEDNHYAISLIINDGISSVYNWRNELDKVDLYKIMVKGKGKFNAWLSSFRPFVLSEAELRLNNIATNQFIVPDNRYGITSPADASNILSVGAYTNLDSWVNINNDTFQVNQSVGSLANLSSLGPTIDGRVKPEIAAPGLAVISSIPSQVDVETSEILAENIIISDSPRRALFSGTSMSTPVVTGSVALLLEHNPFLTHSEIKELITSSAVVDEDVLDWGAAPNMGFGYGKLSVLEALLATIELTNTQEIDPAEDLFRFSVFPNPASDVVNLKYTLPNSGNILIKVSNAVGQPIYQAEDFFTRGNHDLNLNIDNWASGWYIARITDGRSMATKVFIKK